MQSYKSVWLRHPENGGKSGYVQTGDAANGGQVENTSYYILFIINKGKPRWFFVGGAGGNNKNDTYNQPPPPPPEHDFLALHPQKV